MDEWINSEVNRAKAIDQDKADAAERERSLSSQRASVWSDITYLVKDAVKKINASSEIVKKLGGSPLNYQELNISSFQIVKDVYPAVYLTVSDSHQHIRIDRKLVTNGQSRKVIEQHEKLEFGLDGEGKIFLKSEDGGALTVSDAVRHMLKPLLNY